MFKTIVFNSFLEVKIFLKIQAILLFSSKSNTSKMKNVEKVKVKIKNSANNYLKYKIFIFNY